MFISVRYRLESTYINKLKVKPKTNNGSIHPIAGIAVFARCKPNNPFEEIYDDEVTDVTENDIMSIQKLLERSRQFER